MDSKGPKLTKIDQNSTQLNQNEAPLIQNSTQNRPAVTQFDQKWTQKAQNWPKPIETDQNQNQNWPKKLVQISCRNENDTHIRLKRYFELVIKPEIDVISQSKRIKMDLTMKQWNNLQSSCWIKRNRWQKKKRHDENEINEAVWIKSAAAVNSHDG